MSDRINKIIQVISYLLQKEKKMNYTKLIKLVFFADKLHLKTYWNIITWDNYRALKMGPVASLTLDIIRIPEDYSLDNQLPFKKDWYDLVETKKITDFDYLSETEKNTLDKIYDTFGKYSWNKLVDMTHKCIEWKSCNICDWMNYESFFENSKWQNSIFDIDDEKVALAKDLFLERFEYEI